MSQNPSWPRLQALWSPGGHIGYGPSAASYELLPWLDITSRLIGSWNIARGRQYELDQFTAGTWSGVLDNRDGLFDPGNTGSAVAGQVTPYQPFRIRAQWPPSTNLLTIDQATGGEGTPLAAGTVGTTFGLTGLYGQPTVFASASAWQGTQVWQVQVPAGVTAGNSVAKVGPLPIAVGAGLPYAFSVRIRSVTAGANTAVVPYVRWQNAAGNMISTITAPSVSLTGSATAGWTPVGIAGTAPSGAAGVFIGLTLEAAPATAWTFQMDGVQFEQNSGATTFQLPGTWFNLFTGGVERYPQTWRQQGTLGQVQATAVDALALLSQSKLTDPFTAAAFRTPGAPLPTFAYMLDDQAGGVFLDATGQRDPAQVAIGIEGAGAVTAGVTRTAAVPAGNFACPVGTTVVNIASTAPTGVGDYDLPRNMSYIQLPPSRAGLLGPGTGGQGFTRMIAFRVLAAPKAQSAIWLASWKGPQTTAVGLWVNPDLSVSAVYQGPNNQGAAGIHYLGQAGIGNWHLAYIGLTADGTSCSSGFDSIQYGTAVTPAFVPPTGGYGQDLIGAANYNDVEYNLSGDVALAIEWAGAIDSDQWNAIYAAWRTGWAGDSADQRFGKILSAAAWMGPASVDSDTASLMAATDLVDTDAASALQAVTDTEGGTMYCDAAGTVVLEPRSQRWNPPPSPVVFGENTAAGEWPYEDQPGFDYDPTLVTNLAEITQASTNIIFTGQDFASQMANGVRDRQVTSQSTNAQECQDQANFLVNRYKTSHTRVAALTVNPSANPAMWPAVLGLDLGSRVKAVRRPPAPAVPVAVDGFVENIAWSVDTTGEAKLTLQISPADPNPYGQFDYSTFDHFVFGY
ncbi:hypothetical protein KGQ19_16050 [Catenulispora sp. NL8]|uniref:Minor tail protein n=1 Tax=Catenulispora pinistramenti TaxID=2705254 RepID=A0ABS5KQU5_9ACTN|nr:hypothetical protein [Catenulispora pinistramenti]MBS2548379.1 hypothetical protein [Catenulispora pinistramenti]